jgi:hypothetical protein
MPLSDFITRATKTFDPSKNQVDLAGITLDGVTSITIDTVEAYKVIEGTHSSYTTPIKTNANTVKTTVTVLPTADSNNKLWQLKRYVDTNGGMFEMSVQSNGFLVMSGVSWFTSTPSYSLSFEPNDLTWSFCTKLSTDTTEIVFSTLS